MNWWPLAFALARVVTHALGTFALLRSTTIFLDIFASRLVVGVHALYFGGTVVAVFTAPHRVPAIILAGVLLLVYIYRQILSQVFHRKSMR